MKEIRRVDPPDCACTECIIGESMPVNYLSPPEAEKVLSGDIENASSFDLNEIAIQHNVSEPKDEHYPLTEILEGLTRQYEATEYPATVRKFVRDLATLVRMEGL